MVRSVWRGVMVLIKGAGVLAAILGILLLIAIIWFSLNPPFASSETGRLHASASRELRLEAGQTTIAVSLEARLNDNAMRPSSGQPGPPGLRATISSFEGSTLEGVQFRLAPGEARPPLDNVRETGGSRLAWTMPCSEGTGPACRQLVVLLVQAAPSAVERRWLLKVDGDLQYPAFVATPGWSSFELELRSVGNERGTDPSPLAEATGTLELSVDRPIIVVPVHIEHGGAPDTGGAVPQAALRLTIDAARLTETAPTGLGAPPPVRASVLAKDGTVLARQGVRPGQEGRVLGLALDAGTASCPSDFLLAFEWMDARPEADYRLNWRAEVIGLPANDRAPVPVSIHAGNSELIDIAGTVVTPGSEREPLRGQHLELLIAGPSVDELAGSLLHLQLLVTATVDETDEVGTTIVLIDALTISGSLGIPFHVNPGESGAVVVNLEDTCNAGQCGPVVLQASTSNRDGAAVATQLDVTWRFEVRAWRFAPDGPPVTLSVEVR